MELISTYENGNRIAKVYSDPVSGFTVEYLMNNRIMRKTHHISTELANAIAEDFIAEGGDTPTLLNE